MKLPKELNTTKWAETQDLIFAGKKMPDSIWEFEPLCIAQEAITPTNLTLRHRLIKSATLKAIPALSAWDVELSHAISQFNRLRQGEYWVEGASYWDYVVVGLEWYRKRHKLPVDIVVDMEAISASYKAIFPCPLPEVRDMGNPGEGWNYVSTPSYFQKKWQNPDGTLRAYILIALNTKAKPRNFHSHLEAGYFAFWKDEWVVRCKPYTGFNFQESVTSSVLAECLPSGAILPVWRIKPPKVKVSQMATENGLIFYFTWNNGFFLRQSRTIEVSPDKVVVTDGGLFRRDKVTQFDIPFLEE